MQEWQQYKKTKLKKVKWNGAALNIKSGLKLRYQMSIRYTISDIYQISIRYTISDVIHDVYHQQNNVPLSLYSHRASRKICINTVEVD